MGHAINSITLKGYKSIRSLESFPLKRLNVLIGANGSGKSNFVSFFTFLRELVEGRLALAVNKGGGADAHLYLGPKVTKRIEVALRFGVNGYEFALEPTVDNRLVFANERIVFKGDLAKELLSVDRSIGKGHDESNLQTQIENRNRNEKISKYIYESISSWTVYHFHDTSETAPMRRVCSVRDSRRLRPDGSNLAAYLLKLRRSKKWSSTYRLIVETIRLVAPFFDDFRLSPRESKEGEVVDLEWTQKNSDYPFHPSQFSDGTIRFIALATALLQPEPPATILIDEPELGLHPFALGTLASLIRQASTRTQLIVSTQSAELLNGFEPENIVVIDRNEGESRFRRLTEKELKLWLDEEYTLGELWQKGVYGGGPAHE